MSRLHFVGLLFYDSPSVYPSKRERKMVLFVEEKGLFFFSFALQHRVSGGEQAASSVR